MSSHLIQTSFNAGEWTERLEGRVDLAKYPNAVYKLENMIIDPRGPAQLRPGFRYIAGTKTNAAKSRLIPFEFSTAQAYALEFGNAYIRFYRNQGQIYSSGTTPYEIASPYATADLADIKYCQSADVLYLFHPSYAPRKLSRTGHTAWTLTTINFKPPAVKEQGIKPAATLTPAAVTGAGINFTAGSAVFLTGDVGRTITSGVGRASIVGFTSTSVVICDIIDDFASTSAIASQSWSLLGSPNGNLEPSIKGPVGAICTLTSKDTAEVFTNLLDHPVVPNDNWKASGSGTDEYYLANTASFYSAVSPSKMYQNAVLMTTGALGSLGLAQWVFGDNDALGYNTIYARLTDGTDPDTKSTNAAPDDDYLKRSAVTAAANLFRSADKGKYLRIQGGFIKINVVSSALIVTGEILKELNDTVATTNWTLESDVWSATNGYPSCGTFFEERLCLAGSTAYPETVWGSVVGDYENHTPGVDDSDAFEFTLAGRQVNVIQWVEPREYLIVGTAGAEWRLGPEDSGKALTPLNVVAKQQTTFGCADMMPATVGISTLFLQRQGRKIREFTFQWESNGYVAPDLTVLAEHLTRAGITGMAFQQEPASILWTIDNNGALAGMTYLRDQEVVGWHRHPMGTAQVESICTIPGTGYDELWAIIKRTVNGGTVRYVEMMEEMFDDTAAAYIANKGLNAFFVDSGITYSGASTSTITGLGHLEGETVAVLASGSLQTSKVVSGGSITISPAATVAHVGLAYTGMLQMMRLNANLQDGTSQGRLKKIHELTIRVYRSGPFKAGRNMTNLDVIIDRDRQITLGAPYDLFTGDLLTGFDSSWETEGRLIIVQNIPMPLTVVALMPDVSIA